MSTVPTAAELAMLRGGVTDWMQSTVTRYTKQAVKGASGVKETLVAGASTPGRLYSRQIVQPLATPTTGGPAAVLTVTAQFVEVPVSVALSIKDVVQVDGVAYEVVSDATPTDPHRTLGNSYRVSRLTVGTPG